jgi:hypothetical protein
MVLNFNRSQCCLSKGSYTRAVSSVSSTSSDAPSVSGYTYSTPDSQFDNSSTDGRYPSTVSSASSNPLTYDDTHSLRAITGCVDNYQCRPKLESWLAETRLESDTDVAADAATTATVAAATTTVVPATQRRHPRRTAAPDPASTCSQRSPPALTRQEDRTEGFVALLVGKQGSSKPTRSPPN